MYCYNCGKEIADNSKFCKYCGAKMQDPNIDTAYNETTENTPYAENNQYISNQYINNQPTYNQYTNSQYANGQYTNDKYTNDKYANNQYANNHYPNTQNAGNQYPGNQYPGNQYPGNQNPANQEFKLNVSYSANNTKTPHTTQSSKAPSSGKGILIGIIAAVAAVVIIGIIAAFILLGKGKSQNTHTNAGTAIATETTEAAEEQMESLGENGKITCYVVDADNADIKIANATITITGTSIGKPKTVTTDESGYFEITLQGGIYTLNIKADGYQTTVINNVQVTKGQINNLDGNIEMTAGEAENADTENKDPGTEIAENKTTENKTTENKTAVDQTAPKDAYLPILQKYAEIQEKLAGGWTIGEDDYTQEIYNDDYINYEVLNWMLGSGSENSMVYYAIADIDNDTIQELIIGVDESESGDINVYDVFTQEENTIISRFSHSECSGQYGNRDCLFLKEDGYYVEEVFEASDYYTTDLFHLNSNGTIYSIRTIGCEEGSYYVMDENTNWEEEEISEQEYDAYYADMTNMPNLTLDWHTIDQ